MSRKLICLLAFLLVGVAYIPTAHADEAIGYIFFDLSNPPNQGEFDVVNQTGPNDSTLPDTTFPVATTLHFSGLSLTGSTGTLFGLDADGISWDGSLVSASTVAALKSITLTGTLSTTSLTLTDGTTVTVNPSFTATITDAAGIGDLDFAVIYATPGSGGGGGGTVPEPESLVLVATGFAGLAGFRRRLMQAVTSKLSGRVLGMTLAFAALFVATAGAHAQVKLNTWTSPSAGVAGVTQVVLTGSAFPPSINPTAVTITFASSCGGTVITSLSPSSVTPILGTSDKLQFTVPSSLTTGTYFVAVSGTNLTGTAFSSTGCSEIQVTATTTTLAACVPTSSLAVSVGSNVDAYVPFGSWCCSGGTGIERVPLEGSDAAMNFKTPGDVNSCAANSVTGVIVCSENGTNVDIINGVTLTTVTSGSNTFASFTGGECQNCGVAINPTTNNAVVAMGLTGKSGSGLQFLDLSNNTFQTPIPVSNYVSEDISIDSGRNLILSPGEGGVYDILKIGAGNTLTEYGMSIGGTLDSAAEDCTTGIALAADEFTDVIFITDLTQAVFTAGTPGTWTAPGQFINLNDGGYAAGTSGISSAPGSGHLGVVTGEFGGSAYSSLQYPSTSGTGTPKLADYAYVAAMPNLPTGAAFNAGFDPHTMTAYTSPNNGKSYAVFADYAGDSPDYLGVVDLACVLLLPRTAGTHTVTGSAASCTRYIPVP